MINDFIYELKLLWGDITPKARIAIGVTIAVMFVVL